MKRYNWAHPQQVPILKNCGFSLAQGDDAQGLLLDSECGLGLVDFVVYLGLLPSTRVGFSLSWRGGGGRTSKELTPILFNMRRLGNDGSLRFGGL